MTCYPERKNGRRTGTWLAEAFVCGKRVRARFPTHRDGVRWVDIVKVTGALPNEAGEPDEGMTVGQAAEAALAAGGPKGKWGSGRDRCLKQRIAYVVGFLGARTPLSQVTTARLDDMVKDLGRKASGRRSKTLGTKTINRYLSTASSILQFAVDRGELASKPKVPWRAEAEGRILWLTQEDEDAICAALQAQGCEAEAFIVRVLCRTGLRWGELAGLTPGQVEDDWLRVWKSKSDRPRSVPIEQPMARQLRAMVVAGTVPGTSTMYYRFKQAVKASGRNPDFSIHSCRHTFASRLVQAGVALPKVQKLLGHSSIVMTMKYVHIHDDDLVEAVRNLAPTAGQSAPDTSPEVVQFPMKSTG